MAINPGPEENSANLWRILLVEDNSNDAELCSYALRKARKDVCIDVVRTSDEFVQHLRDKEYDVIISDYSLSGWTGLDALNHLRTEHDTPFILVTGALGEVQAVECIKYGVSDYILKDRLERLPLAISKTLEEKRLRDERERARQAVEESEAKFRTLAESLPAATFIQQGTRCCYVNRAAEQITGYSKAELEEITFWQLVHPDSRKGAMDRASKDVSRYELKILTKANELRWLDVTVSMFHYEGALAALITAFDISNRKHEEEGVAHTKGADPLTGLPDYTRLAEGFYAESKRSERKGRCCALLVVNVGDPRKLNETHGHQGADQALCRVARILLQCRASDTPARLQAGEFAVLLPETSREGAQTLGQRIVAKVALDSNGPPLSCSFASAVFPYDGKNIQELLDVARQRLPGPVETAPSLL